METTFDLLAWRAALAGAAAVPTTSDLADWADRLAEAGEDTASALLSDVAALHEGFSPQAIATRQGLAPGGIAWSSPSTAGEDWTLHHGLAELHALAREAAAAGLPRLSTPSLPAPSGRPDNPAGIGGGIPAPPATGDVANVARRLRALLEDEAADVNELPPLLECLAEADRRCPAFDYRTYANSSLAVLVPAIALAGLVDFALSTRDLWRGPTGSPGLLHHVARLDGAALGPYIANVGRLLRNARDLIDLARIARDAALAAGDDGAEPEAWIALLSRGCRKQLLDELIDELGDRAACRTMGAILDRAGSRPVATIDVNLVMRVRDAALDNAEYGLAARAQRVVIRVHPDNRLEHLILGTIEASGGEFGRAEAIFRHWLALAPDDEDLRRRLLAVIRDRFDEFAITRGYGSPADRRDARLRRRGVLPDYQRRPGQRIRAVDVG